MEAWYCTNLGYRVKWRPSTREVYLTSGEDVLALHQLDESGMDHFGFVVTDVDAWAVRLNATATTHRDGSRSFYLRDPEGNSVQVLSVP